MCGCVYIWLNLNGRLSEFFEYDVELHLVFGGMGVKTEN